ncbi:acylneuraminate cytidylyltransferase family protein [Cellulosilyticum sp. I15G10I2]|uniref:acylneuraminate cytidylyltransferase family protein n=1 Tax=Cellulosilyticum sp. I15G10I2 TaxID=1892843 RepID=UPI00085BEA98|nr:acylneuraminate cytidylyltransferase family protein [Cellulosilyticum sp. I15G10I2]
MYHHKSFLAIIPARSGSKGIIDKNIKRMNDKPLMAYTIEAAVKAQIFDDIIVSTDSMEYAKTASAYGASIPFIRPKELARDTTSTYEVILHVLQELKFQGKTYDYFMILQPTSPLRNERHITQSIDVLLSCEADAVVSICELEHPSFLNVCLHTNGALDFPLSSSENLRRQDVAKEYRINGAIYLCKTSYFLKQKSFYGEKTYPYIMSQIASIDIDNMEQFKHAEWLMQR